MRLELGRLFATALAGLVLAGASACGGAAPDAPAGPPASSTPPAGSGDSKALCDAVMKARKTALDALAPASAALSKVMPSAQDIAGATDTLKAAFTAMHVDVAAAAEHAGDPGLKAMFSAYQFSVEQAIVIVEGADGDPAVLKSAIELPEMRSAENAVMAACA